MPAAAVIPAPRAYIKVVAVKKLVVGFQFIITLNLDSSSFLLIWTFFLGSLLFKYFTLKKLGCFKQAYLPEYYSMG